MKRAWRMIQEEPYRLFFPLGAFAGIWGVMMWPALYAGMLKFYPGEAHTRMMVEGFMGAFVAGFLGTAFPRLTGNRTWSAGELLVVAGLWGMTVLSHAGNHVAAGDAAFAGMLMILLAGMLRRVIFGHRDTPPPGFILVVAGVLGAMLSAGFLALNPSPSPTQWQWARLCLFQGFLLLPLMGIGPYVLPRFFGMASSHSFDDSPTPPSGWWRRAVMALIAGLLIVAGLTLEVYGMALAGQWLRGLVILAWFATETPILRRAIVSTTPANSVRWAIGGLVLGCLCAGFWPMQRVGSLHLFFVAGIGLITLTVATRVILGHAGRHDLLSGKIVWLRWLVGLAVLAATTRMSADFLPKIRTSHHIYAAWTWAALSAIWLVALGRFLLRDEASAATPSRCPRKRAGKPQE